ncbi:uncharacterized protein H6S33_004716 [Morchella sextelata]|uniref:uncharacterized protein n=1 Tax=Morchella sextelata TaxID=1174677 RepID=UPI001D046220|nr:uncharacterized protein H6S33_004716 [Morchella sextelata]KAH0605494.1 hypothetical protein H6S33_004716 [Morchella sextelata]
MIVVNGHLGFAAPASNTSLRSHLWQLTDPRSGVLYTFIAKVLGIDKCYQLVMINHSQSYPYQTSSLVLEGFLGDEARNSIQRWLLLIRGRRSDLAELSSQVQCSEASSEFKALMQVLAEVLAHLLNGQAPQASLGIIAGVHH